ncbi:MAG: hypothetical protein ACRDMX_02510 [Solirubrobacteraceae bacterium]
MSTCTLSAPVEQAAEPMASGTYRWECGHPLPVFGGGRHRVYFEPGITALDNPVMDRVCPDCGRCLPGKNA